MRAKTSRIPIRGRRRPPPISERIVPPGDRQGCRCTSGGCYSCSCVYRAEYCSPRCHCDPDVCDNQQNRGIEPTGLVRQISPPPEFFEVEAPLRDEEGELVALFEMADLGQGNLLQGGGQQPAADVPGPIGIPVPGIADPAVVNPVAGNNGLQPNPPVLVEGPANAAAANGPAIPAIVNPAIVNPHGAIGANPVPDFNQLLATMQNQQVTYTQVLQAMTDRLQQMVGDRALPPVRAIMPKDVHYSGSRTECYETWLGKINPTAVAEQWNDNDRRRAAIGTLRGTALK